MRRISERPPPPNEFLLVAVNPPPPSVNSSSASFEEALNVVDEELGRLGGPFFLGKDLSLVDITFTPFLERMVASLAYYKGLRMVGTGRWANLEKW
eukprot:1193826-Prorocentrum_minimum.AAC.1